MKKKRWAFTLSSKDGCFQAYFPFYDLNNSFYLTPIKNLILQSELFLSRPQTFALKVCGVLLFKVLVDFLTIAYRFSVPL